MKKIISLALVLMMAVSILILPTAAAKTNTQVSINYIAQKPTLDGVVKDGEYGTKIHSSKGYKTDEFIDAYDKDHTVDEDFYMTWTDDSLYMAWVVHTDNHWPIDLTKDYNKDGKADAASDGADLGFMYMFSCVQFMLSTGEPKASLPAGYTKYQTAEWSGNYLEVGLSIQKDGESKKIAWSKPLGGENLTTDSWDFSGARDNAKKTTTYEVRIPWNKSGIKQVGNGVKFGLTYAVGDQENIDTAPNMIEWQDAILDKKNMDAGAVITLQGKSTGGVSSVSFVTSDVVLPKGGFVLPAKATSLKVDGINTALQVGKSEIITKTDKLGDYNLKGSTLVLARPQAGTTGKFSVVSVTNNDSATPTIADLKTGDIILAYQSNGTGTAGYEKAALAQKLVAGDVIVAQGYDIAKGTKINSDALIYVTRELNPTDDTSSTSSVQTTSSDSSSSVASSSKVTSTSSVSQAASSEAPEEEGNSALIWIIVAAVVVIGGGVAAYFIIAKKKKQ